MSVLTTQQGLAYPAGSQTVTPARDMAITEGDSDAFYRNADSSAAKVLVLIDALAGSRSVLGLTELAAMTRLSKSTTHRLLAVLTAQGFVHRVDDRYCLSEHLFEVANTIGLCRPNGVRHRAMPFLAELFAQTRQTIHLAVLRGTEVLYVEKLFGHDAAQCGTAIGARKPAYATALGKAMLAYSPGDLIARNMGVNFRRLTPYTIAGPGQLERALARVRETGLSTDHEEYRLGVACLAVPVLDPRTGLAVAGLSICSVSTHGLERKYSRLLVSVANELSRNHMEHFPDADLA